MPKNFLLGLCLSLLSLGCPAGQTPCNPDGSCDSKLVCVDGFCLQRKACTSDLQCAIGQFCDARDELCDTGCGDGTITNDNDERCPTGQSCFLGQCGKAICGPRADPPGSTEEPCFTGAPNHVTSDARSQCRKGFHLCVNNGQAWSLCYNEVKAAAKEICDGIDNDCNGEVDELPECKTPCKISEIRRCDTAPERTRFATIGSDLRCARGYQYCAPSALDPSKGEWGPCLKERTTTLDKAHVEGCFTDDADCDGKRDAPNECLCTKEGDKRDCYLGPKDTAGKGTCKSGTQICESVCRIEVKPGESCPKGSEYLRWKSCVGSVLPLPEEGEDCNGKDDDCNGTVDDRSDKPGEPLQRPCYPSDTAGCDSQGNCKGSCARGLETCKDGIWSLCVGAITPKNKEDCL